MKEDNNNANNELEVKSNNSSKIIIVILAVLLVGALGFICYDKFINKEKPPIPTPIPSNNNESNTDDNEIKYLKSLDLTDENQTIQIGGKSFKLHVEDFDEYDPGKLFINDTLIKENEFDGILAEIVYYTNEFAFFVAKGQSNNYYISYAIDRYGNKLDIKGDSYQMEGFKLNNGIITATGAICCDATETTDSKIKTLSINYVNNSIIVEEYK